MKSNTILEAIQFLDENYFFSLEDSLLYGLRIDSDNTEISDTIEDVELCDLTMADIDDTCYLTMIAQENGNETYITMLHEIKSINSLVHIIDSCGFNIFKVCETDEVIRVLESEFK